VSLPHALLVALTERPCSGSDLAERFDRSLGHFWHATHQQIYRELARLETQGLVEALPEESTRGRKRAYQVLPAGRKELARWLSQPCDPSPLRSEMMVRLHAEAAIGPSGFEKELRRRLTFHEATLAQYREFERCEFTEGVDRREKALRYLVLRGGIMHEENWIELIRSALEILSRP
jgi:DNA-binding PadR family transcriptional regulator